ncbi:MAG: hypothetical protein BWX44_01629 [Spirochaetes bacterium ADurb.Bin001]|nr:MAG: hypothetical protein BWX44_01629 [Spirochaetes bacterium ADurb.Bin001]
MFFNVFLIFICILCVADHIKINVMINILFILLDELDVRININRLSLAPGTESS